MAGWRSWRARTGRVVSWLLAALPLWLAFGPAGLISQALAQSTGGSVGGSDWGGGSSSGGSSGGWSGSTGSSGHVAAGSAYEPPAWAQLLIAIAFMVFLYYLFSWIAGVSGPSQVTVSVARVGVDARARRFVQGRLDELARSADTRSAGGLAALLRAASNALVAARLAWNYVGAQTRAPEAAPEARAHHARITSDARSRFQHELVRATGGKEVRQDAPALEAREHEGQGSVVVTIVVATTAKLPAASGTPAELDALLAAFATLSSGEIKAVEIVWSPAAEKDRMSTDELEQRYPELTKIAAVGGRVFCGHCRGPHTAELSRCPHCGAPVVVSDP
jgi:uncharacterized membrane protein